MPSLIDQFTEAARRIGAEVVPCATAQDVATYIKNNAQGPILLPPSASCERFSLKQALQAEGISPVTGALRDVASTAGAGVTGCNFALADTGTIVLESTDENVRLATTLPEKHFVLLDPTKVVTDGLEAVPHLRTMQAAKPATYTAYISGPSRTADIERVLTIGVHGPKQLHILLVDGLSDNFQEA